MTVSGTALGAVGNRGQKGSQVVIWPAPVTEPSTSVGDRRLSRSKRIRELGKQFSLRPV